MNPKVSIIVPVYRTPELLFRACMDSILNPVDCEVEVILVVDGQEDPIEHVVRQFALSNQNIKVLVNDENRGPAFSRNRGLDVARADYVMMVDADDTVDMKSVLKAVSYCDRYDLMYCALRSKRLQPNEPLIDSGSGRFLMGRIGQDESEIGQCESILRAVRMSSVGIVIRRSLIEVNAIRYPTIFHHNEDFIFMTRIVLLEGSFGLLDKVAYRIVVHSDSLSKRVNLGCFWDQIKAAVMMLSMLRGLGLNRSILRHYAELVWTELKQIGPASRILASAGVEMRAKMVRDVKWGIEDYVEVFKPALTVFGWLFVRGYIFAALHCLPLLPLFGFGERGLRHFHMLYKED